MHLTFLNMPIEFYSPQSGGAIATIIMETSRALLAAGHAVSILTPATTDPQYPVGNVIPLAITQRNDLSFPQRRFNALRTRLHRWDWPYYHYYKKAYTRALKSLPVAPDALITFNDLITPRYLRSLCPNARIFTWLQNEWNSAPANIPLTPAATNPLLTCSQYIADWTARRHHIPTSRFAAVPSGVNSATFHPRPNFLAPASPLKVLFLGRIDPNKGPDLAAKAVARLQSENLHISLTVAGGLWFYQRGNERADPFFQELQSLMKSANATYLGHVPRDRVPALVREHDVACVLSRSNEPFGLVALEAMASGCAVIASNRGGLPEACGNAGIQLDPDNFPAVLHALRTLATDPAALAAQKKLSLQRAQSASWGNVARQLIGLTAGQPVSVPAEPREEPSPLPRASPLEVSA